MAVIKTENYELSANVSGSMDSARLAFIHPGFLETCEYGHMRAYVDTFSKLGCLAISYDPPGIWGSQIKDDRDQLEKPYQMHGYSLFRQIDAGKEVIENQIDLNPDLAITNIGHSLGGMVATYLAALFPNNVDSIILDRAPFTWVRDSNKGDRQAWQEAGVETFYKNNPSGGEDVAFEVNSAFNQYAAVYNGSPLIQNLLIKKLHIAGRFDSTVKLADVKIGMETAAGPKELKITNTDHHYLSSADILRNALLAKSRLPVRVKPPYSNARIIKKNMAIAQDWMERMELILK